MNFLALGDSQANIVKPPQESNVLRRNFSRYTDHRGEEGRYVDVNSVSLSQDIFLIAVRYLDQNPISKPVIAYEIDFLNSLSDVEFDFTLEHERYHLTSGDAFRAYKYYEEHNKYQTRRDLQAIEDDADAHAARQLKRQFNYSRADVESLRPLINRVTSQYQQDERMKNILVCYDESVPKL